jgi:hypothetical protein
LDPVFSVCVNGLCSHTQPNAGHTNPRARGGRGGGKDETVHPSNIICGIACGHRMHLRAPVLLPPPTSPTQHESARVLRPDPTQACGELIWRCDRPLVVAALRAHTLATSSYTPHIPHHDAELCTAQLGRVDSCAQVMDNGGLATASPSPAAGSSSTHDAERKKRTDREFDLLDAASILNTWASSRETSRVNSPVNSRPASPTHHNTGESLERFALMTLPLLVRLPLYCKILPEM